MTAIALLGVSAYAIRSGGLESFLQKRKLKNKDKIAALDSQIEAIIVENASLKHNMEVLSTSLDKMVVQNEKLLTSNKNMAMALKEEHERVVKLMNVVSEESAEKLALTKKLEEANSLLSQYECDAKKAGGSEMSGAAESRQFIA
jgi:chromosome segregation ATPase